MLKRSDFSAALVCDFAEVDANGKHTLHGIYAGDVVFHKSPQEWSPYFFLTFHLPKSDQPTPYQAAVEFTPTSQGFLVAGELPAAHGIPAVVVLRGITVELSAPGRVIVRLRLREERWIEVLSKEIAFSSADHRTHVVKPPLTL